MHMLNSQSPKPLYHQLADILLNRTRTGEYPPGSRIPSEHQLAASYGIGRPTVRQAIDLLVRKGVLARKRGSGTFVRAEQKEVDLFSLAGTISSFHKKGISVASRILQRTRLKTIGNLAENPFSCEKAFFLSRLSLVEEMPVLLEDIYLSPELFPNIDKIHMAGRSLSEIVDEHYYMRPTAGKQNFRIGYVTGRKAQYLGISADTPILLVKRFLHFPQAQNAVFSELYCCTDQFVFSQTIGGATDD
jgi:GntR family transcriptional regulator